MNPMKTTFNQCYSIQSNLSSEQEREEKIQEMIARGYVVARTYEFEKERNDYVSTGYHHAKYRHNGSESRKVYGVLFRRSELSGL